MGKRVDIALIDRVKDKLSNLILENQSRLKDCSHIDLRVGVAEGQGAASQDGMRKFSLSDYTLSYGLRVVAGSETPAPGYFGQSLGAADVDDLPEIIQEGLHKAYERAMASSEMKRERKKRWEVLGQALSSTELAPVEVRQDTIPGVYSINPVEVPLEEVSRLAQEASKAVASYDSRVKVNQIMVNTSLNRELVVSSEGANIDRTYALTQALCVVVAIGNGGVQQTHYDCMGHQRGWEILTDGIDEELIKSKPLMQFALDLAADNVSLSETKACPSSDKDVVVVTDPHYNTLLVHEIIGHPTELDRALKLETAYAGRSWLLRSLGENMIGKQIASPLVSAYSDPLLPGYGHYEYDDEGTPASRVMHIDKGIFRGFMNSRQTAATLGVKANGHFKAIDASLVPLIRMSTTVFGAGQHDPQEMIKGVEHGYYLVGHRIPSISESRENFRITARKVFEIKNGELGEMFRDGGIMANTRDYLMSIDAVGNDLRVYPVFNCGKGQPMQAKKLGNGGPTLRGRARLVGGTK
ncbi:MAG: TldD/PmbA family protein [Dehalococcoidia bacterium]|nr:TldD/PmbA family protein [Dehalococcoidia bacterium]